MLYERSSEKEVTPARGGNLVHSTSSRCSSLDECTRGFRKNFSFQRVEDFKKKACLVVAFPHKSIARNSSKLIFRRCPKTVQQHCMSCCGVSTQINCAKFLKTDL